MGLSSLIEIEDDFCPQHLSCGYAYLRANSIFVESFCLGFFILIDIFRTHTQDHLSAQLPSQGGFCLVPFQVKLSSARSVSEIHHCFSAFLFHNAVEEIHGRGTDEARHEQIGRMIIQLNGRFHLLDHSVFHDHDPGSQSHGFCLVVSHINDGSRQIFMEFGKLNAHLCPQLGVQIG